MSLVVRRETLGLLLKVKMGARIGVTREKQVSVTWWDLLCQLLSRTSFICKTPQLDTLRKFMKKIKLTD